MNPHLHYRLQISPSLFLLTNQRCGQWNHFIDLFLINFLSNYLVTFSSYFFLINSCKWEARHGAAIGLREVLKKHGVSVGKKAGISKEESQQEHADSLEDCAIRLICVLGLDKFGDFVSSRVSFIGEDYGLFLIV